MKKMIRKGVILYGTLFLGLSTLLSGCNKGANIWQNSEVQQEVYEPEITEFKYDRCDYVKAQYRSMDASYPVFAKPKESTGQISLQLVRDQEIYYKRDEEQGVYYVIRSLQFSTFYDEKQDKQNYVVKNKNGDFFVDDENSKEMQSFKLRLYNVPAFFTMQNAEIAYTDSYISETVMVQPDGQELLTYNYVMEFDMTDDEENQYRQTKQMEEEQLCKLLNQSIIGIEANWDYIGYDDMKFHQSNYYIVRTISDSDFTSIQLNKLTTTGGGYSGK